MGEANPNYDTINTLAIAIYESLVSYCVLFKIDAPFLAEVPVEKYHYPDQDKGSVRAYKQVPYEQLPSGVRGKLYDLALETIHESRKRVLG